MDYKTKIIPHLIIVILCLGSVTIYGQPTISFTFDDGITKDRSGYAFEEWNEMILNTLNKHNLKAVFFVTGSNKSDIKGKYLLQSWDKQGHLLGNHTYSHPNFNSDKIGALEFREELLGVDTIIEGYENGKKLFRFPYLKEGDNPAEVAEIRKHLADQGYKNGYVTIDASDWYIDSRLRKSLSKNLNTDLEKFKSFYLEHLMDRALFYEKISYALNGRHISHTILLHHNLAAALFLDDLIEHFKSNGLNVISAEEAYKDPVFNQIPKYAGESLIWALAKDTGKFNELLRYPAEDSRYEKDRMDLLGL